MPEVAQDDLIVDYRENLPIDSDIVYIGIALIHLPIHLYSKDHFFNGLIWGVQDVYS